MEELIFYKVYVKEGDTYGRVVISHTLAFKAKPIYAMIQRWKVGEYPSLQVVEATGEGKDLVE